MQHQPTTQQLAIFGHFQSSLRDLIVTALAGTGKTTTILEAIKRSSDPSVLVCAFNKRIQTAMEEMLEGVDFGERFVGVRTLHSLGFEILRSHWRGVHMDKGIADRLAGQCFLGSARHRYHVVSIVRYCKDVHPRIYLKEVADVIEVCREKISDLKLLDNPTALYAIAKGVIDTMRLSLARRTEIDFADMLWLPLVHNMMPPSRFKRVVVDESQDLSLGQFEMVERLVARGGGIAIVGDLRQGIYSFRGADGPAIWQRMRDRGAVELPLTVSFRCARSIVDEAQRLVPEIQCLPSAPEGFVKEIDVSELADLVEVGDFVLSRTNADLITVAVDTWIKGVDVVVEGSDDLLDELLQILRDKLNVTSQERYQRSLKGWYEEQKKKAEKKDSVWNERVEDWYAILSAVGYRVGPDRIENALRGVFGSVHQRRRKGDDDEWFSEAGTAVSFSTVHKAKGLEARRVFLLQESFRQHRPDVSAENVDPEEWNIEYVGVTRAKLEEYWVRLPWYNREEEV